MGARKEAVPVLHAPDPAKVAETLMAKPERLALVRLARQNRHDHVIWIAYGRDRGHADG